MSEAFIVRRGAAAPKRLWIIKDGALGEDFTGFTAAVNDPGKVSASVKLNPDSVALELGGWYNGSSMAYFNLNEAVDISPYSLMCVELSQSGAREGYMGVNNSQGWAGEAASAAISAITARQSVSLDISNVNSPKYPFVAIQGQGPNTGNTAYVYNMYLER